MRLTRTATLTALTIGALTFGGTAVARETAAAPDLRSNAFYIVDAHDSTVLAARNEQRAAPIASITKLMTALVVLDSGPDMDEVITISRDDVQATLKSGSRLAPGMRLTRRDLMHLALMSSENRAAHALCRTYPGGEPACVSAMNQKARALGMHSAHFVEPTGLSSSNVSSAVDLARLVRAAAENPVIRDFSTDAEHTVYVRGRPMQFRSTNALVKKPDWQVTVQKTGYIAEAGRCLVMQAIIDGRDVVIVLLNSWGKLTRIGDANRVRDWMETYHPDQG
ncbi:MAG: serine hydrolase [Steroidobacteraceae bacterium]